MKQSPNIQMIHGDCMDYMAGLPDNAFDLAIVDPPYGIGEDGGKQRTRGSKKKNGVKKGWDSNPPDKKYFRELKKVSKNQIIWGGNYFEVTPSKCWIIWDKLDYGSDFADFEMAWTSFDSAAKSFRYSRQANQSRPGKPRIHPTQKPVALYKWLLTNYAKPGDKILDTHGGSGSICIACHDLGFDLVWIEKDEDYYKAAVKRFKNHTAQLRLF